MKTIFSFTTLIVASLLLSCLPTHAETCPQLDGKSAGATAETFFAGYLKALNDGKISVDEFLDLNEKVGGFDEDGDYAAQRETADIRGLRALYRSGLANSGGGGLATVPIIHYRNYTDGTGDIHSRERDLVIRARLDRANGGHDNEVIWVASAPPTPTASLGTLALNAMTKWLDAMAADPAPLSPEKVVRYKPAEATDAYWEGMTRHNAPATTDPDSAYNKAFPLHSEVRLVAGAPWTDDVFKCQLKPIRMTNYKVAFSAGQQARLKRLFPAGVCDFSKPGVGQVKFGGVWRRY